MCVCSKCATAYWVAHAVAFSLSPQNPIDAYTAVRQSQNAHTADINGNQAGDPVKGVAAVIETVEAGKAPLYLFLGADAVGMAEQKITLLNSEIEANRALSVSTGF